MKKIALLLLTLFTFVNLVQCQGLKLKRSFTANFLSDSIKISYAEADSALVIKRKYSTCLVQSRLNEASVSIFQKQNIMLKDSFSIEKNKRVFFEKQYQESESKKKKARGENWLWRLGGLVIVFLSINR